MSERYLEIERVLGVVEKIATSFSNALSLFLILVMFGDLLGISVPELLWTAITRPPVIPVDIIVQYWYVWYGMQCVLLVLLIVDYVVFLRFMQLKKMPPVSYVRYVSLVMFILSFWLAILFRKLTFILIALMSSLTLMYSLLGRE